MSQRITKRKSGTSLVKQGGSKQDALRPVTAGGVTVHVPQKRVNLVKGGLIGGGVGMAFLVSLAAPPAAIILGGMALVGLGATIGNAVDEEKARR